MLIYTCKEFKKKTCFYEHKTYFLFLRKSAKIVATRADLLAQICTKSFVSFGPDSLGELTVLPQTSHLFRGLGGDLLGKGRRRREGYEKGREGNGVRK